MCHLYVHVLAYINVTLVSTSDTLAPLAGRRNELLAASICIRYRVLLSYFIVHETNYILYDLVNCGFSGSVPTKTIALKVQSVIVL